MGLYTAEFTNELFETQRKEITLEAVDHDYEKPEYTWIETKTGYKVEAKTVCRFNSEHTLSETVTAKYVVITEATSEAEGKGVYYADFNNDTFDRQIKEVVIERTGYSNPDDFDYEVNSDGSLTITGYYGEDRIVYIPNKINGKTVKTIGEEAFSDRSDIVKVVIPSSVTRIKDSAFAYCNNLETVKVPDSVNFIGDSAFTGCQKLGDSDGFFVIKNVLYNYCGKSENVRIPSGVIKIGDAFSTNEMIKSVVIPDSVKTIGDYSFYECSNLTTVIMSNNVTTIGKDAFYNCTNLEYFDLPGSLKTVGDGAFYGCAHFADENGFIVVRNVLMDYVGNAADIVIPSTVNRIGDEACSYKNVVSVAIPDSVKEIGMMAFEWCERLSSITIPYGVTKLDWCAFNSCNNLKSIVLPATIKTIDISCFEDCYSLKDVYYGGSKSQWNSIVLAGYDPNDEEDVEYYEEHNRLNHATIHYKTGSLFTYKTNSNGSLTITGYEGEESVIAIPSTINGKKVTGIAEQTFWDDTSITGVSIPNTVKSIGDFAFYGCSNLKTITLPDSLTSIGIYAFEGCSSLTSISIPDSLTSIPVGMLQNCTKLVSVYIPSSVKSIGGLAFSGCSNLYEVSIPNGVTAVELGTFSGCESLEEITVPASVTQILENAFEGCTNLVNIDIPNVTFIGKEAFKNCTGIESIHSTALRTVMENAFEGCTSLTDIGMINAETIGSYAFTECESLETISIVNSLKTVETGAFRYCSDNITVHFYGSEEEWNNVNIENYNDPLLNADVIYHELPKTFKFTAKTIDVSVNESKQLPMEVTPEGVDLSSLIWSATPAGIVTIDGHGSVTGVSPGTATISVLSVDNKVSSSIKVTCKAVALNGLTISAPAPNVNVGEELSLSVTYEPENTSYKDVFWVSEDEDIATIDEDGILTGIIPGTVTIYATSKDKTIKSNNLTIEVTIPVAGVVIEEDDIDLAIGDAKQLTAVIEPENAFNHDVVWASEDDTIAVVDGNGTVTVVGEGTTYITATSVDGGFVARCEVTGHVVLAESISITTDITELRYGETAQLEVQFTPANTTNQNVTWTSSDENVLKVDENGLVTPVWEGTATITATSEDGSFTDSREIEVLFTHIDEVNFTETETTITAGLSKQLDLHFEPYDVSEKAATFEVISGGEYLTVEPDTGVITALEFNAEAGWKPREAVVRATTKDGSITADCTVTIYPDAVYVKAILDQKYTGKGLKPVLEVYDGDRKLTEKTDYTVAYKNNTKAGTATATIKMKGNYSKSQTVTFNIEQIDLNDDEVIAVDELSVQATGKTLSPVPVVYFNGKKLKNKADYTVSYENYGDRIASGEHTVTITGKGNFTGTREVPVHVASKDLVSAAKWKVTVKALKYADLTEENFEESVKNTITVKNVDPACYTIEGIDAEDRKIGSFKVTLTGNEENGYYGKRTVTVKITGISLTDKKVKPVSLSYPYTGEEIEIPSGTSVLTYNGAPLTEGTDYEIVSYEKNTNAGKATVTIKGINNYTGTKKVTYTISADTSSKESLVAVAEAYYSKGGSKPKVTVEGLTEGTDYTVKYSKNTKANTEGTAVISFKGNYKGTPFVTRTFYIQPKDISEVTVTAKDMIYTTKAGKYKSTPVLTDTDGKKLKAGTDYEKVYNYTDANGQPLSEPVPVGTIVKVTVTGKGNYTGETYTEYRIVDTGKDISKMSFKVSNKEYTGRPVTIEEGDITSIKLGKKVQELKLGENYIITGYTNNVKKGTATVTFEGIGEYGGTKTVKFKITQRNIGTWWKGILEFFN